MRKLLSLLTIVIIAVAVLNTGAAFGAAHERTVPYDGSGSGTDTIPVLGGSTFVVDGTITSEFGPGTIHIEGTQTGPTSFVFTSTVTYRSGTVTSTASGTDTGVNTSTSIGTITGGTRRFAGVTGSSTATATTSATSDPQVRTITFTFTGSITFNHGK